MGTFTEIVILIAVLAAMVMILLAIRQLSHFEGFDDADETLKLKDEIRDKDKILSHNNIFHTLVDPDKKEELKKEKIQKEKKSP